MTNVSAIYLASESDFGGTPAATNVKVLRNTIRKAMTPSNPNNNKAFNHASILINGRGSFITKNILIADNIFENQIKGTAYIHIENDLAQGVNIIRNTFNGSRQPFEIQMNNSQYNLKNNTSNGVALPNQINNPGIIPPGY